jgi:hypothetical protein
MFVWHAAVNEERMKNESSVADPDPNPDPHVFRPPESGSVSQRYGSGPAPILLSLGKISKKNLDFYFF